MLVFVLLRIGLNILGSSRRRLWIGVSTTTKDESGSSDALRLIILLEFWPSNTGRWGQASGFVIVWRRKTSTDVLE